MKHVLRDVATILLSVAIALAISELDLIEKLFSISENVGVIGAFVAGLFFTSIFTTAPAIVALGEISQVEPLLVVAAIGAVGAVIGDMAIFYLFRNHVSEDINSLLKKMKVKPFHFLRMGTLRWLSVIVGAFIISSPLPDELGIAMLGFSKLNTRFFVPISFVFNFLGILAIGFASRLI